MEKTRIKIRPMTTQDTFSSELIDENNYWAEAIKESDKFFYQVGNVIVEISEKEYRQVIDNPYLYYFSTALHLHLRIKRSLDEH